MVQSRSQQGRGIWSLLYWTRDDTKGHETTTAACAYTPNTSYRAPQFAVHRSPFAMSALLRFPRIGFVMCYLRHQCPSSRTFHGLSPAIKTIGRQQVTCSKSGHVLVGLSQQRFDLRSAIRDQSSVVEPPAN